MLKKYRFLSLLMLAGIVVKAQEETKLPANMFLETLPNGMEVLVVEDHTVPLVSLDISFKAGAINETRATNGLIGIYNGMMARGNQEFPTATAFDYQSGALGLQGTDRVTSAENTSIYFTLPKEHLQEGLKYISLPVRFPSLNPSDLEKEKQSTIDQIREKTTQPVFGLAMEMDRQLWGDEFSRKVAIGDSNVIRSATIKMMYAIKSKYFNPDNALLVVGGDVNHAEAFKQVEAVFGDWQTAAGNDQGQWLAPEFTPLNKSKYFIVGSDLARTPLLEIYWHGPDTRNDVDATYAADVFSYILNQSSSRLRTALIQSGLATTVSFGYLTLKHTGPISLIITPNPGKIRECMDEANRQVALMDNDDYITNDEIAKAKRMLEINDIRKEDITSNFVQTLSFWWTSATLDYYFTYLDNLKKVSRADLKKYVDKYIKNRPYCEGLLINPALRAEIKADDFFKAGN
jgi:zinc protease